MFCGPITSSFLARHNNKLAIDAHFIEDFVIKSTLQVASSCSHIQSDWAYLKCILKPMHFERVKRECLQLLKQNKETLHMRRLPLHFLCYFFTEKIDDFFHKDELWAYMLFKLNANALAFAGDAFFLQHKRFKPNWTKLNRISWINTQTIWNNCLILGNKYIFSWDSPTNCLRCAWKWE